MEVNTAKGAEKKDTCTITFKNKEHRDFYKEYLQKCRYQDVYHKALVYCLGIDINIPNFLYITSRQMNKYYPEILFRTAYIWRLFCKYRDKTFFGITLYVNSEIKGIIQEVSLSKKCHEKRR